MKTAGFMIAMILSTALLPVQISAAESASLQGIASWYSRSDAFINKKTANGEIFDDTLRTCASWHFPIGSYVKVTNVKNGKSVICRVNDRGPKKSLKRTVDLTKSSFGKIADPKKGLTKVSVTRVKRPAAAGKRS